jgi:hypothetical protein
MVAAGVRFVSAPREEPSGRLAVFLDLKETVGTSWAVTPADRRVSIELGSVHRAGALLLYVL